MQQILAAFCHHLYISDEVGCSQIRDSEDMRVPEPAEPTFVLRSAEVFANVTIMVLKHFWDPMTEISGVTCLHHQKSAPLEQLWLQSD